jgi:cellulose synthase/poly-beta-1,6-N-acetylglucosamine synthase-like glycosyltransferase
MVKFIFWFSLIMMFYTYIGYPVLITILAKFKRKKLLPELSEYPRVSIIIPVFNEEDVIQRKIESCLGINYPKEKIEILIGSDGSTDRTNRIVESYINKGIRLFFNKERRGKPYTINKLVRVSTAEILFFSDARQLIDKDALIKLVRNFQDLKVGCVSGELIYSKTRSITSKGLGIYWKYEKYLRKKESDIYSMIGATGAIYACRKELFEPIPEDIVLDDVYTPLVVVKKGYRAIFEREALAYDDISETSRQEYRRKKRTLYGNYQIFFRMSYMLNPFKSKLAFQIISHKLFRVIMPFFMVSCFLSNLRLSTLPFYNILFVAHSFFYIIALTEALFRAKLKTFGIPYYFCLLNFSALAGLWNFLFNRQNIKWEKVRMVYE